MTHSHFFMMTKLVTTGIDPVAVEISPDSVIMYHQDMKIIEEEADTMIIQQVADVRPPKALIVVDDTDVFVLFLHFCCKENIPVIAWSSVIIILMASPIHGCHC